MLKIIFIIYLAAIYSTIISVWKYSDFTDMDSLKCFYPFIVIEIYITML